jgi:ABC-2 type transport system ATP-binding protein
MLRGGKSIIDFNNLHKRYGDVVALNGLSLRVEPGEIYGLLGPNGAGKTTALRVICGLLRPDSGSGSCLGQPPGASQSRLGYMPQRGGLYDDLSVVENLRFFARAHGLRDIRGKVAAALDEHGLGARARQSAGDLSGGWRQRASLAVALLHEPTLLLLDEPSAGLDLLVREALWQNLRTLTASGMTALVTTHHADEAERCDRIGYLVQGSLRVEGPPAQIAEKLGLAVWHYPPDATPTPARSGLCLLHDSAGWRAVGRVADVESAVVAGAGGTPAVPRLADALSWLAAQQELAP